MVEPSISESSVLVSDEPGDYGALRLISINRSSKRNAMDTSTMDRLRAELVRADHTSEVAAIVLTGEGGNFSAGGDLHEFAGTTNRSAALSRARLLADLQLLPRRLGTPVIAAIHGATVGGGAALALSADMVVAGDNLRFGFPELTRSIIPSAVMPHLVHQLGQRQAFELLTTGRIIDAATSLHLGLVNRVVPTAQVVTEALELAGAIAAVEPVAMRRTKRLFYTSLDLPADVSLNLGMDVVADTWTPPVA